MNISNRTRVALFIAIFFAVFAISLVFENTLIQIIKNDATALLYSVLALSLIGNLLLNYHVLMLSAKMIEYSNFQKYFVDMRYMPSGHLIINSQSFMKSIGWIWFILILTCDGFISLSVLARLTSARPYTIEDAKDIAVLFTIMNMLCAFHVISPFPYMKKQVASQHVVQYQPQPQYQKPTETKKKKSFWK
jgi:hypothetical protein